MAKQIGIVLNGGIRVTGKGYFLPSTYVTFVTGILNHCERLPLLMDMATSSDRSFADWQIPEQVPILLYRNSVSPSVLSKFLNYIKIFLTAFTAHLPDHLYVFFPGNLPLALLPGILFRRKAYSIYLRGQVCYNNMFLNWFVHKILKRAQFIIATGAATAAYARQFNARVEEVVPMMKVSRADLWRRESFALSSPARLLFFSRIEHDKGIFECIEAVKKLVAQGRDIVLDIAGGGSPDLLEAVAREAAALKERVTMLGQITENERIASLFKQANIYLFPSHHEGFPRVLYEAMTFSTPIITTDIPGTVGAMESGRNCLKVPVKDADALAGAIAQLLDDEPIRQSLGESGYQTMEKFFARIEGNSHAKQFLRLLSENKSQDIVIRSMV